MSDSLRYSGTRYSGCTPTFYVSSSRCCSHKHTNLVQHVSPLGSSRSSASYSPNSSTSNRPPASNSRPPPASTLSPSSPAHHLPFAPLPPLRTRQSNIALYPPSLGSAIPIPSSVPLGPHYENLMIRMIHRLVETTSTTEMTRRKGAMK